MPFLIILLLYSRGFILAGLLPAKIIAKMGAAVLSSA